MAAVATKERGEVCSTEEVLALLRDGKAVLRRKINLSRVRHRITWVGWTTGEKGDGWYAEAILSACGDTPAELEDQTPLRCPYVVGQTIRVKETWTIAPRDEYRQYPGTHVERTWPGTMDRPHVRSRWNRVHNIIFRADGEYVAFTGERECWMSSRLMPAWASRLTPTVLSVGAEQVGGEWFWVREVAVNNDGSERA